MPRIDSAKADEIRRDNPNWNRPWTEDEFNVIRTVFEQHKNTLSACEIDREIARVLGRTVETVTPYRTKMGLKIGQRKAPKREYIETLTNWERNQVSKAFGLRGKRLQLATIEDIMAVVEGAKAARDAK